MFHLAYNALFSLAIASLAFVACSNPPATNTPLPKIVLATATPTVTPTASPPTPTPTPAPPSASQALADTRDALAAANTYRFSLSATEANMPQRDVSGIWIAPTAYEISISMPLCPPPVPGAPPLNDCLLLPVYRELMNEGKAYGQALNSAESNWAPGSNLNQFALDFLNKGISPAEHLINSFNLDGESSVSEAQVDGVLSYQVTIDNGANHRTWIHIHRESNVLLTAVVASGASTQMWTFTGYDEALAIRAPVPSDTTPVITWLEDKTIRLIEDDPRFTNAPLRPFRASHTPAVNSLVEAISSGKSIAHKDFVTGDRVLTIHFTDGTRFFLSQATSKLTAEPIADHWLLHGTSPTVIQSVLLNSWWSQIDNLFEMVNLVTWPDEMALSQPARFYGEGWPDEAVILSTNINGRQIQFGEARTTQGTWIWNGSLPSGTQPGLQIFQVEVKNPNHFQRTPEVKKIIVKAATEFAINGREVHVIYTTSGRSQLPDKAPLWVGKPEDQETLRRLISEINNAKSAPPSSGEIDISDALHIRHPDGSETLLYFAGDCGVLAPTTFCSDNRWTLSHLNPDGLQASTAVNIDSAFLSSWWRQRATSLTAVEPLEISEFIGSSGAVTLAGQGWPIGDSVTIQIASQGTKLITTEASLYFGAYSLSIENLVFPSGPLEITVTGKGAGAPSVTLSHWPN